MKAKHRIAELEAALRAVRVIAPRIIKAIPEYGYEMGLVEKALGYNKPSQELLDKLGDDMRND